MYFGIIEELRYECNTEHKLIEALILVVCGILCGIDKLSIIGIMNSLVENKGNQIAIDDKTIRSTEKMSLFEKLLQIIYAYDTEDYISLGQMAIDNKKNQSLKSNMFKCLLNNKILLDIIFSFRNISSL